MLIPVWLVSGTVVVSTPVRTAVCPGQMVQYSCYTSSLVRRINWNVYCQEGNVESLPVDLALNGSEGNFECRFSNFEMVSTNYVVTIESNGDGVHSNISITVLNTNYSITSSNTLTIQCESSDQLRYLDLQG